jgi:hypothetical protein
MEGATVSHRTLSARTPWPVAVGDRARRHIYLLKVKPGIAEKAKPGLLINSRWTSPFRNGRHAGFPVYPAGPVTITMYVYRYTGLGDYFDMYLNVKIHKL